MGNGQTLQLFLIMSDKQQNVSTDTPCLKQGGKETIEVAAEQDNSPTMQELDIIVRRAVATAESADTDRDQAFLQRISDLKYIRSLANPIEVPEKIGNYRVLDLIGAGGMGQVFKVQHDVLGKVQALKQLPVTRINDSSALQRFKNEITTLGKLDHPNIVSAQYADEVDGRPYLVMDFVDGKTFAELVEDYRIRKEKFPLELACELIRQAATGIAYAHQTGIIHRDIKPANLMLGDGGRVHVLDLGLARIADNFSGSGSLVGGNELTREHQILGTPDYMAPEQIRDSREVDHKTDIYSLGATFYFLLTGEVVHPTPRESTFLNKAISITNDKVSDVRDLRPDVPREVADLIGECLKKSPQERLNSASELAERLKRFPAPDVPERHADNSQQDRDSETATLKGKKHSPVFGRRWLIAGVTIPILMLLALVIKIALPGGGELIIECDNPDAEIEVSFVQDGIEKSEELKVLTGQSIEFSTGTVHVKISGVDATSYELEKDRFTIKRGEKQVVSIRRVKEELPPAPSSRIGAGAIIQPPMVDEIFDVQLMPHPGLSNDPHFQLGHTGDHFDIDQTGELLVFCNKTNVVVRELRTGQVRALVDYPTTSFGWTDVAFDERSEHFAATAKLGNSTARVEIRTIDGRLTKRWQFQTENDSTDSQPSMRIEWVSGKNQLFLWNEFQALLFDTNGKKLNEILLERRNLNDYPSRCWAVHPTGGYATVIFTDGSIRKWDFKRAQLQDFAQTPWLKDGINDAFLKWSPGGDKVIVYALSYPSGKKGRSVQVFDERGKELAQEASAPMPPYAWSADGKFVATADGHFVDANLRPLRNIKLPQNHSPFWVSPNEVIGIRAKYGSPVSCCSLSPSGALRELKSPAQPLLPMGASWADSGELSAFFESPGRGSPLFRWSEEGRGARIEFTGDSDLRSINHLRRPYGISWSSSRDRIAMPMESKSVLIVDSKGSIQSRVPVQPNASDFSMSRDGKRLAYFSSSDTNAQGEQGIVVIHNLDTNKKEREIEVHSVPRPLEWSPDGKWLAGNVNDSKGRRLCVLWGIESEVTHGFDLNRSGEVYFAFSPNSRFLAIGDGTGALPHASEGRRIRVVELNSWNESLLDLDIRIQKRYRPVWSSDSTRLFAGCLCAVSRQGQLKRIGSAEIAGSEFTTFDSKGEILVSGVLTSSDVQRQGLHRIDVNGKWIESLPFRQSLAELCFAKHPHNRPLPSISSDSRRVAIFKTPEIGGIACIDAEGKRILWSGLAFTDGETITLSKNGRVIDGPSEIDQYLIHVIRYPGGRVIPLSKKEYLHRVNKSSVSQRSLYWALNQGAQINGEDGERILDRFSSTGHPGISAANVETFRLSDSKEISSIEFGYLRSFVNLKSLAITNSLVFELPSLRKLDKLKSINLTGCPIQTISELPAEVESLTLSGTNVSASVVAEIIRCNKLKRLNLNGTKIDALNLRELRSLSKLEYLDLRNTSLTQSDIESLSKELDKCEILVD